MDVGSIFLILALVLVVALFVGRPFLQSQSVPQQSEATDQAEHRRSSLLAERDRLLTALQELDFDNRLGKIPSEDYQNTRSGLVQNAALVMRRLDEIPGVGVQDSAEDRIEQAIAARRADAAVARSNSGATGKSSPVAAPAGGSAAALVKDDIEELLATRKRDRQEKSAGFCPKCGKPAQSSDRFCSRCGTTL